MRRFGAYQTLVDLGRGGMADLYVGRVADDPDTLCILKTLRPPVNERRVEMFVDEARLGLLLDHPNVVRTLSVGEEAGRPFIALEYLDGQPVDRLMRRARRDDPRLRWVLLWILAEALGGLHYAHELAMEGAPLNIVHRDFTPQNVFVTYDGQVKVLDFGIAKAVGRLHRTGTGEVKGKLRYMAPEQALGLRIDRRADGFSAGVMLWEFCSGSPFWKTELVDPEIFDDLVGAMYPLAIHGEAPGINSILTKALARDASERYRTAEEMRLDLVVELARMSRIDTLGVTTAALVTELFPDQRERSTKMIARALADERARCVSASAGGTGTDSGGATGT
jgi:eukaryotic-like serine/threonine-protein kinase